MERMQIDLDRPMCAAYLTFQRCLASAHFAGRIVKAQIKDVSRWPESHDLREYEITAIVQRDGAETDVCAQVSICSDAGGDQGQCLLWRERDTFASHVYGRVRLDDLTPVVLS